MLRKMTSKFTLAGLFKRLRFIFIKVMKLQCKYAIVQRPVDQQNIMTNITSIKCRIISEPEETGLYLL